MINSPSKVKPQSIRRYSKYYLTVVTLSSLQFFNAPTRFGRGKRENVAETPPQNRNRRLETGRVYFRENVPGRLVAAARVGPFSSKDSRAYDASRGFRRVPESARRILIMRAKL